MTHLVGYTLAEAADLLELSEPTARMRRHRAVKLVCRILAQEQADDIA